MKTVLSTDWIDVHDHSSVYLVRVFLTDDNEAYMIRKSRNETKFFKVNPELLKLGELGFFEKVMESAEELPSMPIGLKGQ
jgi:hypothetical protein